MIDYILLTGLVGALILVLGAAWPEGKDLIRPMRSVKNWLFAIGALTMLVYALLNYYFAGGAVFFVFLQVFIVITSVMMMLNLSDKIDIPIISLAGVGFVVWSLTLFEGYNTIIFILGLVGIGLGYTLEMGTLKRSMALMLGGVLIAIFSYIEANWIFFWLNVFFAVFSGYYVSRMFLFKN